MNKKPKIILIIVVLVVLIVSGYFFITSYFNTMEEKNFNDTIKNVSNIENESDISANKRTNVSSLKASENSQIYKDSANTTEGESEILRNLSKDTKNETLKKYIDLEVERLDLETKYWKACAEYSESYIDYKKGKISYSKMDSYDDNSEEYGIQVDDKKKEVEEYLGDNPDLKERLENLNIDEDFRIFEVNTDHGSPTILPY